MRIFFALLLCLGAIASIGCSSHENDRYNTRQGSFWSAFSAYTDYENNFLANTAEKRMHSEFEPVMTAFITLWDPKLRLSYIDEMRRQFRLSPEATKKLASEQQEEDQKFYVFILSAATREPSWADLHKKNSMWRITLENADASVQIDPERIELIAQKDETARAFYLKMNTFTTTYKIRFPKEKLNADDLHFHIAGTRGTVVATFKYDPSKTPIDASANAR